MIVKISLSGKSFKGLSDYLRHDVKADTENRGVDPSGSGVLQTSQKWPEIAGSKWRGFAKPGERFQRLSPKAVVLPLHHSPRVLNNIRDLTGILRVLASDQTRSSAERRAVLLVPSRPWQARGDGLGARVAAKPRQFPGAVGIPVNGNPAHERVFRGAGFSPHRDGRAQPAAAEAGLDIYEIKLG